MRGRIAVLLGAVVFASLWAPPALAQDDEAPSIVLGFEIVDDTTVKLVVVEADVPLGALDATISGVDAAPVEPCQLVGSGVCQPEGSLVSIVAFNTTGWDADAVIASITTVAPVDAAELDVRLHLVGDLNAAPITVGLANAVDGSTRPLVAEPRPEPTANPGPSEPTPLPAPTSVDPPPVPLADDDMESTDEGAASGEPAATQGSGGSAVPWIALVIAVFALVAFVALRRAGRPSADLAE